MRISSCRMRCAGSAAALGCAAMVSADIIETRIVRGLDAETRATSGDQQDLDTPEPIISDDFGLFDRGHDSRARTDDERALAEVLATQETFAEPDEIRGRLFTVGVAETRGDRAEARGAGSSWVAYSFVLTEPMRFSLVGAYITRDEEEFFVDSSQISLVQTEGDGFKAIEIDDTGDFEFGGVLPRGAYEFHAQTELVVEAEGEDVGSLVSVIEFGFAMEEQRDCRADINGDGAVDADDFFAFLDLFADDDRRADINGDERIDSFDFFAYLDLFVEGCR